VTDGTVYTHTHACGRSLRSGMRVLSAVRPPGKCRLPGMSKGKWLAAVASTRDRSNEQQWIQTSVLHPRSRCRRGHL